MNASGTRISNAIIKGGIGQSMTIGVYGAAGMNIGPNDTSIASIINQGSDSHNFTWFKLTGKRVANVMVEAKMGPSVWDFFQLAVGEPDYHGADVAWAKKGPNADGRYTTNPNEVPTKNTKPDPGAVVKLLLSSWSDLTETGARTLTAQFMHETGEGTYCFNWNLGNVKCKENETSIPHMYLRDTWELLPLSTAIKMIIASNGLGYLATDAEIKKHKWSRRGGTVVTVFEPPSYVARFKSYSTLADGAARWLDHHRGVAKRFSDYIGTVNSGDCTAVADLLFRAHYYTGNQGDYARNMTIMKLKVDRLLGPAKP
ncbi:MAG TPA: hypothetical protein VGP07_05115 [Polyangia bacterium]